MGLLAGVFKAVLTNVYCCECDDYLEATTKMEVMTTKIKGCEIQHFGTVAKCKECGKEVYPTRTTKENMDKAMVGYEWLQKEIAKDKKKKR